MPDSLRKIIKHILDSYLADSMVEISEDEYSFLLRTIVTRVEIGIHDCVVETIESKCGNHHVTSDEKEGLLKNLPVAKAEGLWEWRTRKIERLRKIIGDLKA